MLYSPLTSLQFSVVPASFPRFSLLHQLNLTWPPGLVEPGLERTIQPQDDEPALALNGLDPVLLPALGRLRSEIDIDGSVLVLLRLIDEDRDITALAVCVDGHPDRVGPEDLAIATSVALSFP